MRTFTGFLLADASNESGVVDDCNFWRFEWILKYLLTFNCRSCHIHIRALRNIRPLLTNDAAIYTANSIVSSRLDYCNSLLCNATEPYLWYDPRTLQRIQNTLVAC